MVCRLLRLVNTRWTTSCSLRVKRGSLVPRVKFVRNSCVANVLGARRGVVSTLCYFLFSESHSLFAFGIWNAILTWEAATSAFDVGTSSCHLLGLPTCHVRLCVRPLKDTTFMQQVHTIRASCICNGGKSCERCAVLLFVLRTTNQCIEVMMCVGQTFCFV